MENKDEMEGNQVTSLRDASLELLNAGFPPESFTVDNVGKDEIYFILAAHMGTARAHLNYDNIEVAEKLLKHCQMLWRTACGMFPSITENKKFCSQVLKFQKWNSQLHIDKKVDEYKSVFS